MKNIVIIGGGLAGSLLAIYLARRGLSVDIYEARGDMRKMSYSSGRSINLALSDRGIMALREVGMDEYVLQEAVPMYGRMIHSISGETKLLPYSGRNDEHINSISRAGLNIALMNEAEKYGGVRFHFNEQCTGFDAAAGAALFSNGRCVMGDTVIATDGAGSAIRNSMYRGGVERFDFSQKWLDHGYKELNIPPSDNESSKSGQQVFALEPNALHIWPRHRFMMIALPNFDGSFTCTLFLAHKGENSFEEISRDYAVRTGEKINAAANLPEKEEPTANSVIQFFKREFPDALELMPTLTQDFFGNPTGNLGTIKCWPWNIGGKALLLGDSAHAMVPFYGQGMNCAFEDIRVLDSLIGKYGADWETIFTEFGKQRKINTDAIQDMAEENFYEMRDATADHVFQRKRELETKLEQSYPGYFSKYSMVTFREDLPYSVAMKKGNAQDKLLMRLCSKVDDINEISLEEVMKKIALIEDDID